MEVKRFLNYMRNSQDFVIISKGLLHRNRAGCRTSKMTDFFLYKYLIDFDCKYEKIDFLMVVTTLGII